MRPLLPITLAATLLMITLAAGLPVLEAANPTACKPGDVFVNEDVRIWFHGAKGFVKVFLRDAANGTQSHFDYRTGDIVERDGAGNTLARMNLERAFPQTSGCVIEETDEWVNMTLTVTDDVQASGGPSVGTATVAFAYHFNKSSSGAKFDLHTVDWPWQGDGELAYAFDVHASEGTLTPAENGVGYSDEAGTPRGYIEWAPNATASYADGHEETAIVDAETQMDGQTARVTLRFTNVTAGYDALAYDPWAGSGAWILVGPVLVGLAPVEGLVPENLAGILRLVG